MSANPILARSAPGAMNDHVSASQRKAARIAGFGYLMIIALGIFAEFVIRSSLITSGDAGATARNIMDSEGLFRLGLAGDLLMLMFDVIVGLALYVLLRPVHASLALLAAWFRLVHAAVYGVTLLTLFILLQLVSGAEYLTVFSADQLDALVLLFADAHSYGYILALVFFGFHLAILGYLLFKSGYLPRVLGIMAVVAATGYLVDSFANVLLSNYGDYETLFALIVFAPAFVAELSLALWLLLRGVRVRRRESHTPAPWMQLTPRG
jgi:hypothetical protein